MKNPISSDDVLEISHFFEKPHVVLLGAGASAAAFPAGDKNGIKLPILKDFVQLLDLKNLLIKAKIDPPYDDFEGIFSSLIADAKTYDLAKEIEERVFDYFSQLTLPDEPTLYDHLIISLREKDTIATFNWDPLLVQVCERNLHRIKNPPSIYFLHGNVAIGICSNCKKMHLLKIGNCPNCHNALTRMPLMYPVGSKDYSKDEAIKKQWERLERDLESAYLFTIFGYSAPKTDIEAVDLLKKAWGSIEEKKLEQIELIVRPGTSEDEVRKRWDDFIHSHHYEVHESFYKSRAGTFPRRSCEIVFAQFQGNIFVDRKEILLPLKTFSQIDTFIAPFVINEAIKYDTNMLASEFE